MKKLLLLPLAALAFTGCDDDDDPADKSRMFTVTVQNVSTPNLVATMRAGGTVPLSPGVFTVTSAVANPMFTVGQRADAGTELIAEDGVIATKLAAVQALTTLRASGSFDSPGGPDMGPAIFAGETSTFTFRAQPGDKLQLETMFVQSNDWFISLGADGLALFSGDTPISGDQSAALALYDAGTEEDTPPGTGPNQKPAQTPTETNKGPADAVTTIQTAASRHPTYTIPALSSVMKITVTAQ